MLENTQNQVIKVDESLYIIQDETVRCFLLLGSDKALLIDTSMSIEDVRGIVRKITSLPVMLANTHADEDHIYCNHQFEEIYMHPSEYALYHNKTHRNDVLKPLWDGDIISLGGLDIKVIANPGHTSGCITFWDMKNKRIIGGDSIQGSDSVLYMFGAERDLLAAVHSLERVIRLCADKVNLIYPSHAKCPIEASAMYGLLDGLKRMLDGQVPGVPTEVMGCKVRAFDIGCATVLYEEHSEFFE